MSWREPVTFDRVQNVVVDYLRGIFDESTVDARGSLPDDWTVASTPVIVVGSDGTSNQDVQTPVSISPIVRLVAWSNSPTTSHDLVMLAAGHMEAATGSFSARLYSGPLDARDPDHGDAELCAVTLRTRIRSTPIT